MLLSNSIVWLKAGVAGLVATTGLSFLFSPTGFWLVLGAGLCLVELFLPVAFTAFTMGLSALVIAGISPFVPSFVLQAVLWLALSTALIFLSRRFLPKHKAHSIRDATEAETITEILPGKTGRVLYEGNSWRARCGDEDKAIAPGQKVYVVGREGTTLIVMSENL